MIEKDNSEYKHFLEYFYPYIGPQMPPIADQNSELAEKFLRKYWLPKKEYETFWKPIQDIIFTNTSSLPYFNFSEDYLLIAICGGNLFLENDFNLLINCFRNIGDKYFVVIENSNEDSYVRLKFPTDITWSEIMSGSYISYEVFRMVRGEYFVYTESSKCAKYAANDYLWPLDLIAFKKEYADLFRKNFKISKDEQEKIYNKWLPENYKDRVIDNSK